MSTTLAVVAAPNFRPLCGVRPSVPSVPFRRVLILSADVGEGHAAAARAMTQSIGESMPEAVVTTVDGVAPLGRCFRWAVERGYRRQLRIAPSAYGVIYAVASRVAAVHALLRMLIIAVGRRRLRRLIAAAAP